MSSKRFFVCKKINIKCFFCKMKITFDDQFLITASEDACLIIWKISDKDGRLKQDREIIYSEEILITKSDLEEKVCILSVTFIV